jgi:ABC-type polar amino acid transport system ATPase subunit
MEASISLRGVGKSYETPAGRFAALQDIDLEVAAGEFVAIRGHSGSGKSTLLHLISGIDRPSRGEVVVAGTSLNGSSEDALARWRGRSVGIVFQFFQLLPTLTIAENVMLPMDFADMRPPRERRPHALALLERVGIPEQADKLPSALSGGQQQRAAIARALCMEPKALLFDEPTSALDPELEQEVVKVIKALADEGRTMLLVTHDMRLAADVSDHVVFLHLGRVEEEGPPSELFGNPKTERLRQFLSATVAA